MFLLHRSIDKAFALMHGMKGGVGRWGGGGSSSPLGPGVRAGQASGTGVARLAGRAEQFTFALMLRWDTIFLTPFDTSILNPNLFYVANWCRATGGGWPVIPCDDGRYCRGLSRFYLDTLGFPDFYFAGHPRYIHTCIHVPMPTPLPHPSATRMMC